MREAIFGTALGMLLMHAISINGAAPSKQDNVVEELLAISVRVDARFPSYTVKHLDEVTLYDTDSIRLIVGLGNNSRKQLGIANANSDWTERLRVNVFKVDGIHPADKPAAIRRVNPSRSRRNTLGANQRAEDELVVAHPDGRRLEAGRYRLEVFLDESELSSDARKLRNLLRRELVIVVKAAVSREERQDHLLQLAYLASREGRDAQSRRRLEEVLEINSDSITALNDLGTAFVRSGDCNRGRPFLEKAIRLLETDGDAGLNMSSVSRDDLAEGIRTLLLRRCQMV